MRPLLYVRAPLFAGGADDNRTGYDYAANVQIQLYELKDGAEAFFYGDTWIQILTLKNQT